MIQDRKITAFLKTHAMLADDPSATLSAAQLKAWWDNSPEELRVALNALIDDLRSTTAGASGAQQIGSETIAGVAGNDVYTQIKDVKTQLSNVVLNQIPDNTISTVKLNFSPAITANDVLTRLLTVDGPASGIDAATVSGWKFQTNAGAVEYNDGTGWKPVGGVKNVQRGVTANTLNVNGTPSVVNVTIAAVNISKSSVVLLTDGNQFSVTTQLRLTSATNLEIVTTTTTASGAINISWEIVESY